MIRAVICDDERATWNIIRHFLEQEGYPIEIAGTAANGSEARDLILREKPELVFLDIQMPFLNGFDVIRETQEIGSRVIIITAYDSFAYAQQALRLGATDILSKPIDFDQLREAITRALGWKFTGNTTVNQILSYLHGHYAEQITLSTLSDLTFCTENHIARLFKKHTGTTIMNYVHRLRIYQAEKYLETGRIPVEEAAEKVGYQNLNNFYRHFREITGMTPAAWVQSGRHAAADND